MIIELGRGNGLTHYQGFVENESLECRLWIDNVNGVFSGRSVSGNTEKVRSVVLDIQNKYQNVQVVFDYGNHIMIASNMGYSTVPLAIVAAMDKMRAEWFAAGCPRPDHYNCRSTILPFRMFNDNKPAGHN